MPLLLLVARESRKNRTPLKSASSGLICGARSVTDDCALILIPPIDAGSPVKTIVTPALPVQAMQVTVPPLKFKDALRNTCVPGAKLSDLLPLREMEEH